ncbi:MAG: 50S ribosomal protein L11 methyltransferase [Gammaproteobacteria bacterium]|nr:50S ribosomal protein L11 methyltransferase [Gammaproteobacteria bacterium]
MSEWLELRCRLPAARYAACEALLEGLGASAITTSEGDSEIFAEPGVASEHAWQVFTLTALFEATVDRVALERRLRPLLAPGTDVVFTELAEQHWADAWKEHWQPQGFAGDLWICPTWCEPPAGARHVLRLDPGRAFGTGTHETTALCLDWLAEANLAQARVIDYGCGSGILALAAACFGAAHVDAVDIDDDALEVARENIAQNGYADRIRVGRPDGLLEHAADVLVANILEAPLIALAPRFARLVPHGARIALSGLLATQIPSVVAMYEPAFSMDAPRIRGDWALVSGTRR